MNHHEHHDDDGLTDEQRRAVDEVGFRAGAELRHAPRPGAVELIERRARSHRRLAATTAALGAAALIATLVIVVRRDDGDAEPTDTATVTTVAVATTVGASPTTALPPTTGSTAAAVTTVAPTTVPPTTAPSTTAPATTTAPAETLGTFPVVEHVSIPEPGAPELQASGAAPLHLVVPTDGGRSLHFEPWLPLSVLRDPAQSFDLGPGRDADPLEIDGEPVTVARTVDAGMTTLGVTTDGRVITLGAMTFDGAGSSAPDPFIVELPQPGRVTDACSTPGPYGQYGSWFQGFTLWAAGLEDSNGTSVPTVWQTTGYGAFDGTVERTWGSPGTVPLATGSPGVDGPVLLGCSADAEFGKAWVVALVPEADGSSRLVVVSGPDGLLDVATDLRYRQPVEITVIGDRAFIADADGLHRVDLTDRTTDQVVWPASTVSLHSWWRDPTSQFVTALDGNGTVLVLDGSGTVRAQFDDPTATAVFGYSDALFIVHAGDDDMTILDATALT